MSGARIQCITCQQFGKPNSKGEAPCGITGEITRALESRACADWRLAPMHMVYARSIRRIVFDSNNIASLS